MNTRTHSFVESLEPRRMLSDTASISGRVFNDNDYDKRFDADELAARGQVVFLDTNRNAAHDAGERYTTTASDGSYTFANLPAGTYSVRHKLPAMRVTTTPGRGWNVTLADADRVTSRNFGFALGADIRGSVLRDHDADGNASIDAAITRRLVWIDADNDGVLDPSERTARTDSRGGFQFTGLVGSTYDLRVTLSKGEYVTKPIRGRSLRVGVANGGSASGLKFLVSPPATTSFSGVVFDDLDNNRKISTGDSMRSGIGVFIDKDQDRQYDTGEPRVNTDSAGKFTFSNLFAGTYEFGVIAPAGRRVSNGGYGHMQTYAPNLISGHDFALTSTSNLSGLVIYTRNTRGTTDFSDYQGVPGVSVYVDLNKDGKRQSSEPSDITDSGGSFDLLVASAGNYVVRLVARPGTTFNSPASGMSPIKVGQAVEIESILFSVHTT